MPSEYKPPKYKPPKMCLWMATSPGLIFEILLYKVKVLSFVWSSILVIIKIYTTLCLTSLTKTPPPPTLEVSDIYFEWPPTEGVPEGYDFQYFKTFVR